MKPMPKPCYWGRLAKKMARRYLKDMKAIRTSGLPQSTAVEGISLAQTVLEARP
jgi:hypothetical protein